VLQADSNIKHFEKLDTLTFYSVFILDGFVMILIFAFIMLTIFKHKVYGLTAWLLIGLEVSVVFWVAANIPIFLATDQYK
jgi:hypothetical protein